MIKKTKNTSIPKKRKSRIKDKGKPGNHKKSRTGNPKKKRLTDPEKALEAKRYKNPIASRQLILNTIHDAGIIAFEELAQLLHIKSDEHTEALQNRLRAMVRDGQLVQNRRGGYLPVDEEHLIRGRVVAHPDGFGFLIPDEGSDDLFLHGKQMRTLMHGDKAVVRVSGVDRRGRLEGAVVSIIERANLYVVGRLFHEDGISFVVSDNKRITHDLIVPADSLSGAEEGQIVKAEIVRQPTFKRQPIGRVIDVIGDHMAPGMEIEMAIHNHGLPHIWSEEALVEAEALGESVKEKDKKDRVDLRQIPLVTIDGEDAKDFDDAVYCEPEKGGWKLLVAIADVSHYVPIGSALDKESYERATSVYFPGRVVPMLPESVSNGLCSLKPKVDRLCMVCEMHVDTNGKIKNYHFYEAVMHSHARLTYQQVADALFDKKQSALDVVGDLLPALTHLNDLYTVFSKIRKQRGAIDFDTTETIIEFTDSKRIESIRAFERNDAHKIIEECMISANVCAAEFLLKNKVSTLYRVHDYPDEDRLEDLRGYLGDLGLKLGVPGTKISPKDYAKLTSSINMREDYHLIQLLLLRSMQQAVYKPENSGHFGLALQSYAHFTSPIRRYPDLLVHRGIKSVLNKKRYKNFIYPHSAMVGFGEHCSNNQRRADEASRDAEFALKCQYMLDKVGKEYKGHVKGVTNFGLFVEIDEFYIEGLVHITSLPKDYYEFVPEHHQLRGENRGLVFGLCDAVTVKVVRVNIEDRKIDFELSKADG